MTTIDLSGKKALIMGVANAKSLGWAIGKRLAEAGAELAVTYQAERFRGGVEKATSDVPNCHLYQVDVCSDEELLACFDAIEEDLGQIDIIVHAIAFAPRDAMEGRFLDTTRADWNTALEVSAYSLVSVAKHAEKVLADGASILTLSYHASRKVVPRYNVMAIAKSALEASVRYLAAEMGERGIRVNALSPGPMRTVAARSIPGFLQMYKKAAGIAPLGRNASHDEVGKAGLFLLSDLGSGITGECIYVDAGYNVMAMQVD